MNSFLSKNSQTNLSLLFAKQNINLYNLRKFFTGIVLVKLHYNSYILCEKNVKYHSEISTNCKKLS
jgi:hypothetical protein